MLVAAILLLPAIGPAAELSFDRQAADGSGALQDSISKAKSRFKLGYDGKELACRNAKGEKGLNKISVQELLAAKSGSCGDFRNENLAGADLKGADLAGADLSGAYLLGASLEHANLRGAKLVGAKMSWADFEDANLIEASLRYAYLDNASLKGAAVRGADLGNADLTKANLCGTDLSRANVDGTLMTDAWYDFMTTLPFDDDELELRGLRKAD